MTKLLKNTILVILTFLTIYVVLFYIFDIKSIILKKIYPKKYEQYVTQYSKQYNVDELLIYSIIKIESNFNKQANSSAGATGLMQLIQATASEMLNEVENIQESNNLDLYDPELNIKLGTYYFSTLLEKYNNTGLALAAYNAGMGRVDSWIDDNIIKADGSNLENIPFKETNLYVRKILNCYEIYKDLY